MFQSPRSSIGRARHRISVLRKTSTKRKGGLWHGARKGRAPTSAPGRGGGEGRQPWAEVGTGMGVTVTLPSAGAVPNQVS